MTNTRIFGMLLIASIIAASVLISSENVLASICPPMCVADVDEDEAILAENTTTMMTNQTADGNMTSGDGTNSTS